MGFESELQRDLDELRHTAETGYLRQDLVEQRRALQEFTGEHQGNFYSLLNSYGGAVDKRREAAIRMQQCSNRISPCLPARIRQSLTYLANLAGTWSSDDGLNAFNRYAVERAARTPDRMDAREELRYHWALLDGYENALRVILVRLELPPTPVTRRAKSGAERFPTPPGATWEEVRIRFRDGHTVSIKVRDQTGVFNYTQMGMIDRRNADPSVQWEMLRSFAEGRGTFDWSCPDADRDKQKRREMLARDLQSFFGIEGDPFRLTPDGKGWQARFITSGDA